MSDINQKSNTGKNPKSIAPRRRGDAEARRRGEECSVIRKYIQYLTLSYLSARVSQEMKAEWTLSELAEETGLPARTIRYYIARGLLAGPEVAGRGAVYGSHHLARLREIQSLQREGRMLVGHVFRNGEEQPLEVVYGFMLPREAALRRFEVEGEGFQAHSELRRVEEAVKAYEQGIEAGHLATLARSYRDGVVNLTLG